MIHAVPSARRRAYPELATSGTAGSLPVARRPTRVKPLEMIPMPAPTMFPLGRVVVTHDVLEGLDHKQISVLLRRHQQLDPGSLSPEDVQDNLFSLKEGFRILSAYDVDGSTYWVITEADRSVTTVLLPR